MDELVGRLVAELGIDREVAEKAVGIILAFLIKEAPADKIKPLLDAMPGAAEAAAAAPSGGAFTRPDAVSTAPWSTRPV